MDSNEVMQIRTYKSLFIVISIFIAVIINIASCTAFKHLNDDTTD